MKLRYLLIEKDTIQEFTQPLVLATATLAPLVGMVEPKVSLVAQQISAVGVLAFFLWREMKVNRELRDEIRELHKYILSLLQKKDPEKK